MRFRRSVIYRLVLLTFGTYLSVTVVLTGIQMGVMWRQEQAGLRRELDLLGTAYRNPLMEAVWNLDQSQIHSLLSGLASLPSVCGVRLVSDGLAEGELIRGGVEGGITHTVPLAIPLIPPREVGVLTLYAHRAILLQRLKVSYLVLLANAAIKTVALWLILVWFGRRLISRPLARLERQMDAMHLSRIEEDRRKVARMAEWFRKHHPEDELGSLAVRFAAMTDSLADSKASLDDLHKHLESKVRERTTELDQLNRLLREKNEALERLSTTDALTGISNRLALERILEQEIRRAERYNHPLCVILLDVDHFKQINDRWGHQVGDRVLQEVCRVITERLRATDVLGRWGGEEFLIVAPNASPSSALGLAEALREKLAAHDFGVGRSVSASFGISTFVPGDTVERLLNRADEALYRAKHRGRNRVEAEA
ncbi:MAG: hypothetical protein Kow006_24500 [Gammaproteobacteria bacterium]